MMEYLSVVIGDSDFFFQFVVTRAFQEKPVSIENKRTKLIVDTKRRESNLEYS